MLPTPSTAHICFDNVYEPAEDSYLFLDTLSQSSETSFLSQRFGSLQVPCAPLVVEVGTGSGVILSFIASNAATLLGRQDILTVGTDVNNFACRATVETVNFNLSRAPANARADSGAFLGCFNAHLSSILARHSVDIVVFNPPYVPSEAVPTRAKAGAENDSDFSKESDFERDSHLLSLATDGGEQGMEVTSRLLGDLPRILNPQRGVAYVLLCAQNKPESVKQRIRDWGPEWSAETAGTSGKQGGWEKLQIVRIARTG